MDIVFADKRKYIVNLKNGNSYCNWFNIKKTITNKLLAIRNNLYLSSFINYFLLGIFCNKIKAYLSRIIYHINKLQNHNI